MNGLQYECISTTVKLLEQALETDYAVYREARITAACRTLKEVLKYEDIQRKEVSCANRHPR